MFKAFVSPLPPADLLGKIQTLSDPDEVEPANPTFFPGTLPVVGRVVAADRFIWQRRPAGPWLLWLCSPACWFRPFLTGTVRPRDHGSELRLEGGTSILAKVLWALAFAGVAAVGSIVTVFTYPANISHDPAHSASRFLAGLVITGLAQGLLLLPPAIGWLLTRHDLQFMAERLEKPLALKPISYRDLAPE
ncbi:MAG: hypothetical protein JO015_04685 [Verrucomicrobia bacterium]|nr:hypothetical protein [Verrucomicrobiota bacterium]